MRCWVLLSGLLLLVGCGNPVSLRTVDFVDTEQRLWRTSATAGEASERTLMILRRFDLEGVYRASPEEALLALEEKCKGQETPYDVIWAFADLAIGRGVELEGRDPERAAAWYLAAAGASYDALFRHDVGVDQAFDLHYAQIRRIYNQAVSQYVVLLQREGGVGLVAHRRRLSNHAVDVEIGEPPEAWPADFFELMVPAYALDVKGMRSRHLVSGFGAAMTGLRESPVKGPLDGFYPPEGKIQPVTAVIHFGAFGPRADDDDLWERDARLVFYCPRRTPRIAIDWMEVPLEADFTAPYGMLLERADLRRWSRIGLLNVERAVERSGVYMLEPYDPEKIPILMVHGLMSSPLAWLELTNELQGDPEIRSRYQVWHYLYPTGLPYLYSGSRMKRAIDDLFQAVDPEDDDPATQGLVVIAHSMGGLLTRTAVSESGTVLWDRMFTEPPHELAGTPNQIYEALDVLMFEPEPYIDRVIFIATPHRGSDTAHHWYSRLGSVFVNLPDDFETLMRGLAAANRERLTAGARRLFEGGGVTSIQALGSGSPIILSLADLPIAEGITYHTIVGDRGRGDGVRSSDGVVRFTSSYLEGAASTLVVPSGHDAHAHPRAVAEVRRILGEHWRGRDSVLARR
ncbi:esterase/lipase family protein [Mucisphaera sp.]|uniref:esterase/lipase family protein n=1 Tax=Mucisphaera sp. TaxID=2913024 RepID=UPI003D109C74